MSHTIHNSSESLRSRILGNGQFWSFSLDEIGYYDVPASIDYVLNETGETKVHYIGHSQGTTAFFIMASEKPEYQNKIQTMHAMAPAVFLTNMISPLMRMVTRAITPLYVRFKWSKQYPFHSINLLLKYFQYAKKVFPVHYIYPLKIQQKMCRDIGPVKAICLKMLNYLMGPTDQTNNRLVPIFFSHLPTGAGTTQLIHFGQVNFEFECINETRSIIMTK